MAQNIIRLLLPAIAGVTVLTACQRPVARDFDEVTERFGYRTWDKCSSYLHSYQTGRSYCASPGFKVEVEWDDPAYADQKSAGAEEIALADVDPASHDDMMKLGGQVYGNVCAACHQANGQGLAGSFPPLAGSGDYYGEPQNMTNIIVHGLSGEIVVQGTTFNSAMPPQGHLSDLEIAAAATFVRNSWGNADGDVAVADVEAVR